MGGFKMVKDMKTYTETWALYISPKDPNVKNDDDEAMNTYCIFRVFDKCYLNKTTWTLDSNICHECNKEICPRTKEAYEKRHNSKEFMIYLRYNAISYGKLIEYKLNTECCYKINTECCYSGEICSEENCPFSKGNVEKLIEKHKKENMSKEILNTKEDIWELKPIKKECENMKCVKCGHELIQIEKYCPNCGYNFNEPVKVKEPTEEELLILENFASLLLEPEKVEKWINNKRDAPFKERNCSHCEHCHNPSNILNCECDYLGLCLISPLGGICSRFKFKDEKQKAKFESIILTQPKVELQINTEIKEVEKLMIRCLKCKTEINEGGLYCSHCGSPLIIPNEEPTEEERLIFAINEAVEINKKVNAEKKLKRQELYDFVFKLKNYNFPEISFSFLDRIKLRSNIYSILLCETCIHIEYSIEHHIINIDYNTAYNETTLKNLEKRLNNEDNEIIDQLVSVLPKFKIMCLKKIYKAISGKKWNQPNGFNELMDFIGE
jgi:hypothetical protein